MACMHIMHIVLFWGKGSPLVSERQARHLSRQGRGFVRPPVCPTASDPPTEERQEVNSKTAGIKMSSCVQYILFPCCYIVCHMSLVNYILCLSVLVNIWGITIASSFGKVIIFIEPSVHVMHAGNIDNFQQNDTWCMMLNISTNSISCRG